MRLHRACTVHEGSGVGSTLNACTAFDGRGGEGGLYSACTVLEGKGRGRRPPAHALYLKAGWLGRGASSIRQ